MRQLHAILLLALAVPCAAPPAGAAEPAPAGIEWYGTWDGALAEARRSGRPILLVSAAPHCKNISGMW